MDENIIIKNTIGFNDLENQFQKTVLSRKMYIDKYNITIIGKIVKPLRIYKKAKVTIKLGNLVLITIIPLTAPRAIDNI